MEVNLSSDQFDNIAKAYMIVNS